MQVHLLARPRPLPEGGEGVRFAYQTHYVPWRSDPWRCRSIGRRWVPRWVIFEQDGLASSTLTSWRVWMSLISMLWRTLRSSDLDIKDFLFAMSKALVQVSKLSKPISRRVLRTGWTDWQKSIYGFFFTESSMALALKAKLAQDHRVIILPCKGNRKCVWVATDDACTDEKCLELGQCGWVALWVLERSVIHRPMKTQRYLKLKLFRSKTLLFWRAGYEPYALHGTQLGVEFEATTWRFSMFCVCFQRESLLYRTANPRSTENLWNDEPRHCLPTWATSSWSFGAISSRWGGSWMVPWRSGLLSCLRLSDLLI